MKLYLLGLLCILAPGLQAETPEETVPCDSQSILAAHGLAVLRASAETTENPTFSPEGLRSVFEVLDWGASENARRDIAEYYLEQYRNGDDETASFRLADCAWNTARTSSDAEITASVTDHMFLRQGNAPLQDFLDRIGEHERTTEIHSIPDEGFEDWLQSVNRDIEKSTGGLIKKPLALEPSTEFAVSNIMWFEAPWLSPFDESKTQTADFRLSESESVTVEMMASDARNVLYSEDGEFTRVLLPYEDRDHYMLLLLPNEDSSKVTGEVQTWLDQLDPRALGRRDFFSGASDHPVIDWDGMAGRAVVFLPRFDVAGNIDISDHMKATGFGTLYGDSTAFPGLTGNPLILSRVTQDIRVRTHEEGSAAAAVTTAAMTRSGGLETAREIRFDRPFLFVIGQASSGAIVAMGVVGNPARHE
ncbi:MAG: hypothetical protein OXF88_01945 [Rhodobacteraceae bacterium]|nr:hypothetical protein [Paracoccaceae bacterium]